MPNPLLRLEEHHRREVREKVRARWRGRELWMLSPGHDRLTALELIAMVTSIRPTLLTECLNPHSEEPSQSVRPLCFFPKQVSREYGHALYYESILSWSTRTQEEGKLKQITSR